ncbi:MAG: GNAT family N-acetyltransferase [Pseudomonadota bacterium]
MIPAGTEVDVVITHLEMTARPLYDRPSVPSLGRVALIAAEDPPVWWFLDLYSAVGVRHEWTDMFDLPTEELTAFVTDPEMRIYTMFLQGWPGGFFMLDGREAAVVDIAYFGLVPEAHGRGLGRYLLQTAIHTAWDTSGAEKVTVKTCTLDHPAALPLYQKCGFGAVAQETTRRILTRDREGEI